MIRNLVFFAAFLVGAPSALAQNQVEVEYAHATLTSGYSAWNDVNTFNYFALGSQQFVLEADYKNHFDESAALIGLTYTHVYDPLWYQDFSLSFSTNSSIIPALVAFSELHRKLLSDQSLVVGLGVGYNIDKDPYTDADLLAEAVYYLDAHFSLQAGARFNLSSPGSVLTARGFGSVNFGYEKWQAYLRFEAGREGYTIVADNDFQNEFASRDEAASVRYWFKTSMGVGARLDYYQSDFYNRNEIAIDFLLRY